MITIWLRDRSHALWLAETCIRRAAGREAKLHRVGHYQHVQLPDCAETRRLLDEIGLEANGLYPQDDAVADYRRYNRWRETS